MHCPRKFEHRLSILEIPLQYKPLVALAIHLRMEIRPQQLHKQVKFILRALAP